MVRWLVIFIILCCTAFAEEISTPPEVEVEIVVQEPRTAFIALPIAIAILALVFLLAFLKISE